MKLKFLFLSLLCVLGLNALHAQDDKASGAPKRVVVADGMLPIPALILFLTNAKLEYIPEASKSAFVHSIVSDFYPEMKSIKAGENDNFEELIALNAQLYICHKDGLKLCKTLQNAGLNVLPLSIRGEKFNSKNTLKYWLNELSKEFPIKEKSKALIAEISNTEQENARILKGVKPVRAMMMTIYQGKVVVGAFGKYLLQNSGGVDVFEGVWEKGGGGVVNFEEIYAQDPEVIYITNFSPVMPEDLLKAREWQGVSAIKNKRVYKLPLATYRPYAPNLDLAVLLKFLASKNHPELFKDLDIKAEYQKHFKKFYNLNLSDAQAERILHPSREAGDVK